jgi:adenylate cyclase
MSIKSSLEESVKAILDENIATTTGSIPKLLDPKPSLYGNDGVEFTGVILFIDLRGSTKLFEKHYDNVIAKIFMSYHKGVTTIAKELSGKIRSFNGDSVLVFFEGNTKEVINNAVKCAMQITYFINNILNPKLEAKSYAKIDFGIGIDHGKVLSIKVGIKDEGNRDLAWISDNVNFSAKISDFGANPYHLYISNKVYTNLSDTYKFSNGNNMWVYVLKVLGNNYIGIYKTNYYCTIE